MKSLEEKPVKRVLVTMHLLSYLFALACIAATISWIYFVAKAVEQGDLIGGPDGSVTMEAVIDLQLSMLCSKEPLLLQFFTLLSGITFLIHTHKNI